MQTQEAYSADRSLKGKLRRRLARLALRRPASVRLERPMVSFTFDDAPASALATGARLLKTHGARGSFYISAGLADSEGPMGRFGGRDEVMGAMQAGHEIACHTFSHLDCGRAAQADILADAERNTQALTAWGAPVPVSFAYPYGDVSLQAKRALGGRFAVLRALHHGVVADGTDLNQAPGVGIEGEDGEQIGQQWLERAAAQRAWLILYTHDVTERPSPWGCTPAALERLIVAAARQGFDIVTAAEGARRIGAAPR